MDVFQEKKKQRYLVISGEVMVSERLSRRKPGVQQYLTGKGWISQVYQMVA